MANDAGRPPHSKLQTVRRYSCANGVPLAVHDGDKNGETPENARETLAAASAQKEVAEVVEFLPEMTKEELAIFSRSVEVLHTEARYKRAHVDSIWLYASTLARIQSTLADLKEDGFTYKTYGRNGTQYKRRPEAVQLSEDMSRLSGLCSRFGLTPLDELRFEGGQSDMFGDNPFSKSRD